MPKVGTSSLSKVRGYVSEFPTEFQATTAGLLHCRFCGTVVKHDKRSNVLKHREAAKHQKALSARAPQQSLMSPIEPSTRDEFVRIVTDAFLGANIPLHKLNNSKIKGMFQYMGHRSPSESACRERVPTLARAQLTKLIDTLAGQEIFLITDESEIDGRKYTNTLVGEVRKPSTVYLVSCKVRVLSFLLKQCIFLSPCFSWSLRPVPCSIPNDCVSS